MSLFGKAKDKMMGKGAEMVKVRIKNRLQAVAEEGRLKFVDNSFLDYTDKSGKEHRLDFSAMAAILEMASGEENLLQLGVSHDDVVKIVANEYERQRGG